MLMIKCPYCSVKIFKWALVCPGCGTKRVTKYSSYFNWLGFFSYFSWLSFLIGLPICLVLAVSIDLIFDLSNFMGVVTLIALIVINFKLANHTTTFSTLWAVMVILFFVGVLYNELL